MRYVLGYRYLLLKGCFVEPRRSICINSRPVKAAVGLVSFVWVGETLIEKKACRALLLLVHVKSNPKENFHCSRCFIKY